MRPTPRTASTPASNSAQSPAPRVRRRRPALSLELVLQTAVELLDEQGEQALTLRALAQRLDTGVGSLYHYVSGKDELLDRATNEVLDEVLAGLELPADPYDALRALSLDTYRGMQRHPWVGYYLMRDTGMQPNSMMLFELFGQQVMGLELTPAQRFDIVSSLVSFVTGVGAEMRELPREVLEQGRTQAEMLREYADSWRALPDDRFPFVHSVVDEFEEHDDELQFVAGVELILAGIAALAEGRRAPGNAQ